MKKLFSWMFKPAVLALLGVFLPSLVIWFEAPLLAFDGKVPFGSSGVRWFFILLLVTLWAGYFGWKMIAAHLANKRLMASLAPPPEAASASAAAPGEQAAMAEQAALAQRMQQAMGCSRKPHPEKNNGAASICTSCPGTCSWAHREAARPPRCSIRA